MSNFVTSMHLPGRCFAIPSTSWLALLKINNHWYSKLDLHTTRSGDGVMIFMAITKTRKNGPTWLCSTMPENPSALLCWNQHSLKSSRATFFANPQILCVIVFGTLKKKRLQRSYSLIFEFPFFANKGTRGCKNIRAGGDTTNLDLRTEHSFYMTYVVYRSFKYPPPVKPGG